MIEVRHARAKNTLLDSVGIGFVLRSEPRVRAQPVEEVLGRIAERLCRLSNEHVAVGGLDSLSKGNLRSVLGDLVFKRCGLLQR